MNKVIIEIGRETVVEKEFDDFKTALTFCEGASIIAESVWTRHSSVVGVHRHMNTYLDIYNEGAIELNVPF